MATKHRNDVRKLKVLIFNDKFCLGFSLFSPVSTARQKFASEPQQQILNWLSNTSESKVLLGKIKI